MASESSDESAVRISLPPELDEWLDRQADTLDVSRGALIVQLLSSYRATAAADDDADLADVLGVDRAVETAVADRMEEVARSVDSRIDDRIDERLDAVEDRIDALDDRIDAVDDDFTGKIEDVRERVIQVKREADAKADADHDHAAFDRLDELAADLETLDSRVADLGGAVEGLRAELGEAVEERDDRLDALESDLDDAQEKLRTVAYVVRDLRSDVGGASDRDASVGRIKRAAAEADVTRARCESCGEGVEIGLLADPECPHCEATVTDVEPGSGFFGKPTLVAATAIEATGGDREEP